MAKTIQVISNLDLLRTEAEKQRALRLITEAEHSEILKHLAAVEKLFGD